jgi:hypothetical protein
MKIEIKFKDFEVLLSDETQSAIQYNFNDIIKLISETVVSYNKIEKK